MIARRGTVRVDEDVALTPADETVVIEAFEESERQRVHELMTENWELITLVRRRTDDGHPYTEYQLRAPHG